MEGWENVQEDPRSAQTIMQKTDAIVDSTNLGALSFTIICEANSRTVEYE
jgi:ABC-type uncharacterized transport system ATPase component